MGNAPHVHDYLKELLRMWTYNCARIYVGTYVGSGTNQFEKTINCEYKVIEGNIITRKLKTIKVRETNSETSKATIQLLAVYPSTETATIKVKNSKGSHLVKLIKPHQGSKRSIFRGTF